MTSDCPGRKCAKPKTACNTSAGVAIPLTHQCTTRGALGEKLRVTQRAVSCACGEGEYIIGLFSRYPLPCLLRILFGLRAQQIQPLLEAGNLGGHVLVHTLQPLAERGLLVGRQLHEASPGLLLPGLDRLSVEILSILTAGHRRGRDASCPTPPPRSRLQSSRCGSSPSATFSMYSNASGGENTGLQGPTRTALMQEMGSPNDGDGPTTPVSPRSRAVLYSDPDSTGQGAPRWSRPHVGHPWVCESLTSQVRDAPLGAWPSRPRGEALQGQRDMPSMPTGCPVLPKRSKER